jgi:hypothetical protein
LRVSFSIGSHFELIMPFFCVTIEINEFPI